MTDISDEMVEAATLAFWATDTTVDRFRAALAAALAVLRKTHAVVPRDVDTDVLAKGYEAMFDDKWDGSQAPMMGAGWDAMLAAAEADSHD